MEEDRTGPLYNPKYGSTCLIRAPQINFLVHLDIGISPQSRLRKPLPVSAAVLTRWRALVYSELRYRVVDERAISNPSVVTLDNPLTAVSCARTILIDRSRVVDIGLIIGILQFDNLFVLA
ncbi:hypothetical protein WDU94_013880 [Cyamophila willieti]